MVLFDNVLHRVRFSKFMAIVSQEFNKLVSFFFLFFICNFFGG